MLLESNSIRNDIHPSPALPKGTGGFPSFGGVRGGTARNDDSITNYIDFVYEEIHRIILSVLSDNYSYSDIVILVRGNDFGADIARNLVKNGIPTVSAESLLLSNNNEVNFLLACLSYLSDNQNNIACAVILNFVAAKQNLLKENVFPYAKNNAQFRQFLQDYQYDFKPNRLAKQNLYERVENLLQIFDLTQDANPFILAFLDVVADFIKSGNKTETQFLTYWQENRHKFSLSNPKGINAVTVMTIHQSKGLEFPIVIYPHKNSRNNMGEKWVDLSPDEEVDGLPTTILKVKDMEKTIYHELYEQEQQSLLIDDLNVDYVAFTRAKDRLYFIAHQGDKRGDAVKSFLNKKKSIPLHSDNEGVEYYRFGDPQALQISRTQVVQKEHFLEKYASKPLTANLATRKHEYFWEKDLSSSTTWGTLVHRYLAKVYRKEDVESVLQKIQQDITLDENTRQNIQSVIQNVFFHPQAAVLFGTSDSKIKNELELIDASGQSFRIDRLCINGSQCTVFEYKTGFPKDSHRLQINQYNKLLSNIGFEVIDNYLIYIREDLEVKFG
jgi:ATP-dependent exoDNAse (exonuclease V) beta subunit